MEINKEEYEFAKRLIGQKAILMGGGQLANAFIIVNVIKANDKTGQITVNDGKTERNPYIWSYYLRPLHEELQDLALGDYLICGGEDPEIRKQDCGIFGTIYDCTLMKVYKNNKWVKAEEVD